MRRKQLFTLFALPLLSCTLFACSGNGSKETQTLNVVGSTTVLPAVTKTAEIFMKRRPEVTITVNAGGSGVGVTSIAQGLADIGMISRDISSEEKEKFPDKELIVHPIGKDAVACVVSAAIYDAGIKTLTSDTIKRIFLGEVNNWKDIGGPDRDILVVDKEIHRGTRHVFMEYIFGEENPKTPGSDIVIGSNNEGQSKIGNNDGAIGMLSFAWINEKVKGVGIDVGAQIIYPNIENVKNGSYPISRDLNLVTRGQPSGLNKEFIDFILSSEGQRIVEEAGYVPIKEN